MWPFNRQQRESRVQFAKIIPPEVIDQILAHPEEDWPPSRKLFIGHMVIQARDADLTALERLIPQIIEVIQQHNGTLDSLSSSLITAIFGTPVTTLASSATRCEAAANALVTNWRDDIKIVYGSGEVLVGSWGHPQFCVYGARFPAFSQRLEKLCALNYGELVELDL